MAVDLLSAAQKRLRDQHTRCDGAENEHVQVVQLVLSVTCVFAREPKGGAVADAVADAYLTP